MLNEFFNASAIGSQGPIVYVDDVFSTFLYTGNSSTQTITNGIDLSGEGGLVWIKQRSLANHHWLFDTARGVEKALSSSLANSESTRTGTVTSFGSSGFTLGSDSAVNGTPETTVSWTFRKAPGFFDVVTYTGTGTSGLTVSHNLGSVPGFIIIKNVDEVNAWNCWHRSITSPESNWWQNYLVLNTANAASAWTTGLVSEPTSTSFQVGAGGGVNNDGTTYVAYVFAHDEPVFGTDKDESIIKCGSYTATGSAQSLDLGFEPQFLIIKKTTGTGEWRVHDTMRGMTVGGADAQLDANTSAAEITGNVSGDPAPTGFIVDGSQNDIGATYAYIAIRRSHKPPEAGTDVFAPSISVGGFPSFVTGFPVDFNINGDRPGSDKMYAAARLTGATYLKTNTTQAESASSSFKWDSQTGCVTGWPPYIGWNFRRAPGFFDVATYTGTGSTSANTGQQNIVHNLEAVPELMLVKVRDGTGDFTVYNAISGPTGNMRLNRTNGNIPDIYCWDSTTPTSSVFRVGAALGGDTNVNTKKYIAYLFATLSGISKVGSYTGNSGAQDIDCGFTNGARFVMVKRIDAVANWYVWDTARGIGSGNDPYLRLDTDQAENTSTDFIDIDAAGSGFRINTTYDPVNANGGNFLFLAIA